MAVPMTIGKAARTTALVVLLASVGASGAALVWLRQHVVSFCLEHVNPLATQGAAGSLCRVQMHHDGLSMTTEGLVWPEHQLAASQLEARMPWREAWQLLLSRWFRDSDLGFFPSLQLRVHELQWNSPATGRIQANGGTSSVLARSPLGALEIPFGIDLQWLDHPSKSQGRLEGTLVLQSPVSLGAAGRAEFQLACQGCVLASDAGQQPLVLDLGWQVESGSRRLSRLKVALPQLPLASLQRWLVISPVPPPLAGLRATVTLTDFLTVGHERAATVLEVADLGGHLDLLWLRHLLKRRALDELENLAKRESGPQWTALVKGPLYSSFQKRLEALVEGLIPSRVLVQEGQGQVTVAWDGQRVESHRSSLRVSGLLQDQSKSSPMSVSMDHDTNETSSGPEPKGQLVFAPIQGLASGLRLDLNLRLFSQDTQGKTGNEDPKPASAGALPRRMQQLAMSHPEVQVTLPQAEVAKLLQHFLDAFQRDLGLGLSASEKVSLPDEAQLKDLERHGKEWLKGVLKGQESSGDPASRDQARKQRKEAEQRLKEGLSRILGQ
jgi:hypothetical protein